MEYFRQYEPGDLKCIGQNEYRLKSHDSFRISKNKWYWNSCGIMGNGALDYMVKCLNIPFVDAVKSLCGDIVAYKSLESSTQSSQSIPSTSKAFQLPQKIATTI